MFFVKILFLRIFAQEFVMIREGQVVKLEVCKLYLVAIGYNVPDRPARAKSKREQRLMRLMIVSFLLYVALSFLSFSISDFLGRMLFLVIAIFPAIQTVVSLKQKDFLARLSLQNGCPQEGRYGYSESCQAYIYVTVFQKRILWLTAFAVFAFIIGAALMVEMWHSKSASQILIFLFSFVLLLVPTCDGILEQLVIWYDTKET